MRNFDSTTGTLKVFGATLTLGENESEENKRGEGAIAVLALVGIYYLLRGNFALKDRLQKEIQDFSKFRVAQRPELERDRRNSKDQRKNRKSSINGHILEGWAVWPFRTVRLFS